MDNTPQKNVPKISTFTNITTFNHNREVLKLKYSQRINGKLTELFLLYV